ncbi:MAG TPA: glycosyltransferase family 2 protein [Polyangiaceae bacterium]|nr:glycosyltransferase family 2 protein [Polyangiaceae bacterium]
MRSARRTFAVLSNQSVFVVVPARNESERIGRVIGTMPAFVDGIVVVDDASTDETARRAWECGDARVVVERHADNRGVGAAIVTGYRASVARGADVVAVMAGDAQMDPADLEAVVTPVIRSDADYVKGNRFRHTAVKAMPLPRRVAGRALAFATRLATGLDVHDSQCGYTALSRDAILSLPLEDLWPRYGYPNDLLALLARGGFRVAEVPIRPVYAGEASGIRPWHALVVLGLLARRRMEPRPKRRSPARSSRRPSGGRDGGRSSGRARPS